MSASASGLRYFWCWPCLDLKGSDCERSGKREAGSEVEKGEDVHHDLDIDISTSTWGQLLKGTTIYMTMFTLQQCKSRKVGSKGY
jgi:hypothetical protein